MDRKGETEMTAMERVETPWRSGGDGSRRAVAMRAGGRRAERRRRELGMGEQERRVGMGVTERVRVNDRARVNGEKGEYLFIRKFVRDGRRRTEGVYYKENAIVCCEINV